MCQPGYTAQTGSEPVQQPALIAALVISALSLATAAAALTYVLTDRYRRPVQVNVTTNERRRPRPPRADDMAEVLGDLSEARAPRWGDPELAGDKLDEGLGLRPGAVPVDERPRVAQEALDRMPPGAVERGSGPGYRRGLGDYPPPGPRHASNGPDPIPAPPPIQSPSHVDPYSGGIAQWPPSDWNPRPASPASHFPFDEQHPAGGHV